MTAAVARRNREREGAGKSDRSWIKHSFCEKAAGAQVAAFHRLFPDARMILIDGNAGDGIGVKMQQDDLFDGPRHSKPTPKMLSDLGVQHDAKVCLCERDSVKRRALRACFPNAIVVANHREAADIALGGFNYAFWLSDPNGCAGHGVDQMRRVAMQILRSDFVVVSNELALSRFIGVAHSPYWVKHQAYVPMLQPSWWLQQLPKRFLARTELVKQSPGFHFRLLVISDYLTEGVRRWRNVEIVERK
jgi:hypothetical protein